MIAGKYVIFFVDGERFGLPLWNVERILRAEPVRQIPDAPPELLGLWDFRGDTLPVLDTRVVLACAEADAQVFLVVCVDKNRFALTADSVDRIASFEDDQISEQKRQERTVWVGKSEWDAVVLMSVEDLVPSRILKHALSVAA